MSLKYGFALASTDNSEDFSDALCSVIGNGITQQGGKLEAEVNGFTVKLSSGYALVAGRYLSNDEPYQMTISPPFNNDDRVDALAVRVDYTERKAELHIIKDVDIFEIRSDPSIIRDKNQYCILLYLIRVLRGATSLQPDDITDLRRDSGLCGSVVPLSAITGDVIYIYQFLNSGIDVEMARLIGLSNQVIAKADAAIAELNAAIKAADGGAEIGDLITSRHPLSETGWLLCDGGVVPPGYLALSALVGITLPNISSTDDRYKTYIFGGAPVEV